MIPKFFKNGIHGKFIFAILSMRKQGFGSPKRRTSSQKSIKTWLGKNLKNNTISKHFYPQKLTQTGSEITPKSIKILSFATSCPSCCFLGRPGWSRGAKMVSRSGSDTPKWLPKVLPRCQNGFPRCSRGAKMGSRNGKKEAPSFPNRGKNMMCWDRCSAALLVWNR